MFNFRDTHDGDNDSLRNAANGGDRLHKARRERGMEFADEILGGGPVNTAVGDADAVAEFFARLRQRLAAGGEVALDHRTHDRGIAGGDLCKESAEDLRLKFGFLRGVIVGTVDENGLG